MDEVLDALGHRVQEGDIVIYNLSGTLAKGKIKSLRVTKDHNNWRSWNVYLIQIELIESSLHYPAGKISKVRNPDGIIVLRKGLFNDD